MGGGLRVVEDEVEVLELAVEALEDLQEEVPDEERGEDPDLPRALLAQPRGGGRGEVALRRMIGDHRSPASACEMPCFPLMTRETVAEVTPGERAMS